MIENIFLALGLVLILEGLVYALAPSLVERFLIALSALSEDNRRLLGLAAMAIGLVMVWAAKTLGA
ncbi:hypothetical protein BXY70_1741 [Roseovarius halotolerans]|uniref:DUF2065 domain-containing protein n=1 Tax=Roseovarius halotolerans TaxID=505353 RepID=A0A1X6Z264_9RHOB|nr:DUF2065 domain-containing protein [Roseovarius halotolerans]RKT32405.1 hypothetical protein BXY70_1741 [Roseovarius halotolerans]SLN37777.1 hypothetical protein ROH8110_01966 [Roseovarius halotolerans]